MLFLLGKGRLRKRLLDWNSSRSEKIMLTTVGYTLMCHAEGTFFAFIFNIFRILPEYRFPLLNVLEDNLNICPGIGLIPCWHAVRIFYNRIDPLKETLHNAAIRYFYPMHLVERCSDGGFIYVQEPLIKALIFVNSTDEGLEKIRLKHAGSVAPYYDLRTNKPIVIPDEQMDQFIKICSIKDSGLEYLGDDGPQFHKGDKVRVTDGIFKGLEGHIKRINHDRRLIVTIEGVAAFATKFIPPSFLEKI